MDSFLGIRITDGGAQHVTVSSIGADIHDHVYILDCVWEYFVVVGSDARQKRKDIRLALDIARVRDASLVCFS